MLPQLKYHLGCIFMHVFPRHLLAAVLLRRSHALNSWRVNLPSGDGSTPGPMVMEFGFNTLHMSKERHRIRAYMCISRHMKYLSMHRLHIYYIYTTSIHVYYISIHTSNWFAMSHPISKAPRAPVRCRSFASPPWWRMGPGKGCGQLVAEATWELVAPAGGRKLRSSPSSFCRKWRAPNHPKSSKGKASTFPLPQSWEAVTASGRGWVGLATDWWLGDTSAPIFWVCVGNPNHHCLWFASETDQGPLSSFKRIEHCWFCHCVPHVFTTGFFQHLAPFEVSRCPREKSGPKSLPRYPFLCRSQSCFFSSVTKSCPPAAGRSVRWDYFFGNQQLLAVFERGMDA